MVLCHVWISIICKLSYGCLSLYMTSERREDDQQYKSAATSFQGGEAARKSRRCVSVSTYPSPCFLVYFFLQEMLPCIYRAEKNNVKLPVGLRSDRNPELLLSKSWPVKTHLLLCFSNLLVLLNLSS